MIKRWLFGCVLLCVLLSVRSEPTLPWGYHTSQYVPGQLSLNWDALLVDGSTFSFLPHSDTPLPLVVFAWDQEDPFSYHMVMSDKSVEAFLSSYGKDTDFEQSSFLFLSYQDGGVEIIQQQMNKNLKKLSSSHQTWWKTRLFYASETIPPSSSSSSSSPHGALDSLLYAWPTQNTIIEYYDNDSELKQIMRFDCHYMWAMWPISNNNRLTKTTLTYVGDLCSETFIKHTNVTGLFIIGTTEGCGGERVREDTAYLAKKKGAVGLVVVLDEGEVLGERKLGNEELVFVDLVVTSVSRSGAEALFGGSLPSKLLTQTQVTITISPSQGGYFAAFDTKYQIQEVGWEKYSTLEMLSWCALHLDHEREVEEYLLLGGFDWRVVENEPLPYLSPGMVVPRVPFEATKLHGYFWLSCYGTLDQDCPTWDTISTVVVQCDNDPAHNGDIQLVRGITPFRRRVGRWVVDLSNWAGIFQPGGTCNFTFNRWVAGEFRLRWFSDDMSDAVDKIGEKLGLGKVEERKEVRGEEEENEISGSSSPMSFETLSIHWANPQYNFNPTYNDNKTFDFSVPAGTKRVILSSTITGGGPCEFAPTSHHFTFNDEPGNYNSSDVAYEQYMLAGTPRGCVSYVGKHGSCPNQHGTWYYGRNGWCDCLPAKPFQFDVTKSINLDTTSINHLQYYALSYTQTKEGKPKDPSQNGCGGSISESSFLHFYSS